MLYSYYLNKENHPMNSSLESKAHNTLSHTEMLETGAVK